MENKIIIENIEIDKIKPYPKNPRRNKIAVNQVVESIKSVGYRTPIIIDEDYIILVGHTRFKAIKKMGWEKIPYVIQYKDLTEEKKKEYRIRDNKTSEFASWDYNILIDDIEIDLLKDIGFDLDNKLKIKEDEIKPYDKHHILISYPPELEININEIINKLNEIKGVEIERSAS